MLKNSKIEKCIEDCLECFKVCAETITHCLSKGGMHAKPEHIQLLKDCVKICNTSAEFVLGQSEFESRVCDVCAEVCERCAEDCEKFEDDKAMAVCAEICRRCAESCREMSGVKKAA